MKLKKSKNSKKTVLPNIMEDKNTFLQDNDNLALTNMKKINNFLLEGFEKNNFIKNVIKSLEDEIIKAKSYEILNPIMELKYGKSNKYFRTSSIWQFGNYPLKCYYHEAFSNFVEKKIFELPKFFRDAIIELTLKNYPKVLSFLKKNKTNSYTYFSTHFWRKTNLEEILQFEIDTVIPDVLHKGKYILISTSFDIINLLKDRNYLPRSLNNYILKVQNIYNIPRLFEGTDIITLEYDKLINFRNLTVIDAPIKEWIGKPISSLTIPGSNFQISETYREIIGKLNNKYSDFIDGDITALDFLIEDTYYLGFIKFSKIKDKIVLKIKQINISNFGVYASVIVGDVNIKNDLVIGDNRDDYLFKTDKLTNTTLFNTTIGINQRAFESNSLFNIDNLTNENILNIIKRHGVKSLLSYDIIKKIQHINNEYNNDLSINKKNFQKGEILEEYNNNNNYVLKLPFKINLRKIEIDIINIPSNDVLNIKDSNDFLEILESITRRLKQMESEIENSIKKEQIYTYIEFFTNSQKESFLTSIKVILRRGVILMVITYENITDTMSDASYSKTAKTIFNYYSNFANFLNFSVSVIFDKDNVDKLIETGNSFKYFIDKVNNNPYYANRKDLLFDNDIFFYELESPHKFVFVNSAPMWNKKDANLFYTKEVNLGSKENKGVIFTINEYLKLNYGLDKTDQIFALTYSFNATREISVCYLTEYKGKKYVIGSGDPLNRIVKLGCSIQSDFLVEGGLTIKDSNSNTIFEVDNIDNTLRINNKTGFGLDYPQALVDIKDTTIKDYIDLVSDNTEQIKSLYNIINEIKKLNNITTENSKKIIESYNQNSENYFLLLNIVNNDVVLKNMDNNKKISRKEINNLIDKNINIYDFFYGNKTEGKQIKDIDDPTFFQAKSLILESNRNFYNNFMIYDGSLIMNVASWVSGPKLDIYLMFYHNGKYYMFITGKNVNDNNIRYLTNDNMILLLKLGVYSTLYINTINANINKKKEKKNIINYKQQLKLLDSLNRETTSIPKLYKKYIISKKNIMESKIEFYNSITLETVNSIYISDKPGQKDSLQDIKYLISENTYLQKSMSNINIIQRENRISTYVFTCFENNEDIMILCGVEFDPSKALTTTLQVRGDTKLKGLLTVTEQEEGNDFLSIDPNNKTMSIKEGILKVDKIQMGNKIISLGKDGELYVNDKKIIIE